MGVLPMTQSDASSRLGLVFLFVQFALSAGAICQDAPPGNADVVTPTESDASSPLSGTWKNLAKLRNQAALRLFEQGNHPAALEAFREASRLDPDSAEISNNLAYLLHLLGNRSEAERYYRRTLELDPDRYVAHVNLADLLGDEGETEERLAEAAALLVRARELKGNRSSLILRQARVAARRGLFDETARFYGDYAGVEPPNDERKLEIGDFYLKFGKEDEAIAWFRQISSKRTELAGQAARRIWRIEVDREARRLGWQPRGNDVPGKARMLAAQGRARLREDNVVEARRLLEEALALAPQSAEAHFGLGDLHARQGDLAAAELEYLRALAMESGNADTHARLGRLYARWPGGKRMPEAAIFLGNALQFRPDWSELRLELAQARQAGGDLAGALAEVNRFLAEAAEGNERVRAELLRDGLLRLLSAAGSTPPPAESPVPPGAQDGDAASLLARARALMAHGSPEGALLELRRLPGREQNVEALLLEARILHAVQRPEEACTRLDQVLTFEPKNTEAALLMASLLTEQGKPDTAILYLAVACNEGDPDACFLLVEQDFGQVTAARGAWYAGLTSSGHLERLADEIRKQLVSERPFLHREQAEALLAEIESLLAIRWYGVGACVALALLAGLLILWRRYGGACLDDMIERHPEAAPELHRLLAAVRHEVLKHNTLVLSVLVRRLSHGENIADEAARLHEGLFGAGRGQEGALGRLADYRRRIEQVGRSHGLHLNLRRDPAFGPLLLGFDRLKASSADLLRVEFLSKARRARLAGRLEEAARLLNASGYEALRGLLDRFRTTRVERTVLLDAFSRVRAEPEFGGKSIGEG
ncbi:MAG: tetratricopeptide repeat protein, partial [Deltaproteobacteria bacterium]|nr:tetratricopeptide repeat protein [Deltaproteobacteria bacterium]